MRELSADRPDKIESPYTVDAGHFQLETDFVGWTYDRSNGTRTRSWNGPTPNIKVGLLNNVDLELVFDGYSSEGTTDRTTGRRSSRSGFGNLGTRLKINLFGNDGGGAALAALPYVMFPTSTSEMGASEVEGGIIFPFTVELPAGWEMNLQTAFHSLQNSESHGHHAQFDNAISFGHGIVGKLAGYVEFFTAVRTERGQDWVGTLDFGLTYPITDNVQFDCGVNIGLTPAADDWNPFTGITVRF